MTNYWISNKTQLFLDNCWCCRCRDTKLSVVRPAEPDFDEQRLVEWGPHEKLGNFDQVHHGRTVSIRPNEHATQVNSARKYSKSICHSNNSLYYCFEWFVTRVLQFFQIWTPECPRVGWKRCFHCQVRSFQGGSWCSGRTVLGISAYPTSRWDHNISDFAKHVVWKDQRTKNAI